MAERSGASVEVDKVDACVVGGGPAGLMAAEVLMREGLGVMVAEQMPTMGRKFLMAGKSGLNLTKDEPPGCFATAYVPHDRLATIVHEFGPSQVKEWTEGLGEAVYTGSTGRVFPIAMKASPLLRAWLARLEAAGVTLRRRWRWNGWDGEALRFSTPDGPKRLCAGVTVLALGGASWRRLGSDGTWTHHFCENTTVPFAPANCGFVVDWSGHMTPFLGQAVKGSRLTAATDSTRGEWIVSEPGIEGGGVYEVSRAVREGAPLFLDLFPDLPVEALRRKLAVPRGKRSVSNYLRRTLGLQGVRRALAFEWLRPFPDPTKLPEALKAIPVPVVGPRPMDEAISTAGGVSWNALDPETLMLKPRPGTYVAGEMIDWEAPTGGYLLTGCFATGQRAGTAAAAWLRGTS